MKIQSIRFNKKTYNLTEAKKKAKEMGFKINVTPNPQYVNWWAFRQIQPQKFRKKTIRTKKLDDNIMLIIGELL
jgi:hypothetical protein